MFRALLNKRDRRASARQDKKFAILYSPDQTATWLPSTGLNIGLGGIKVFAQTDIPVGEVPMRLNLGESMILDIRCRQIWSSAGRYKGGVAHEYGMQFAAANAQDRERVQRWLAGGPLVETNKAQEELQEVYLKPDDVARLIPLALQERIFAELVQRGRLAQPDDKHPPLVAYLYGGTTKSSGGMPMHRLTVQSKVVGKEDDQRYATRFMFDDTGAQLTVIEAKH